MANWGYGFTKSAMCKLFSVPHHPSPPMHLIIFIYGLLRHVLFVRPSQSTSPLRLASPVPPSKERPQKHASGTSFLIFCTDSSAVVEENPEAVQGAPWQRQSHRQRRHLAQDSEKDSRRPPHARHPEDSRCGSRQEARRCRRRGDIA